MNPTLKFCLTIVAIIIILMISASCAKVTNDKNYILIAALIIAGLLGNLFRKT